MMTYPIMKGTLIKNEISFIVLKIVFEFILSESNSRGEEKRSELEYPST